MPATGNSGRSICDAERALHMPIMGCIAGRDFRAEVLKFQQEHGLAISGELDSSTHAKLGVR